MLIVSQDRETVVNLDHVKVITVDTRKGENWSVIACFSIQNFEVLGQYPTKERAVEELEVIESTYDVGFKLYSMPKE